MRKTPGPPPGPARRFRCAGALALIGFIASSQVSAAPDAVYVNARIWTGDATRPEVEALAVDDGRISATGPTTEIRKLADASTQVVDLAGRRVVPGFNDAHWHLPSRRTARLDNAGSVDEIRKRMQEYARSRPADAWLVGRGWVPSDFPNNTAHRRYLDDLFPDRPLVLRDRDGHQTLANSRALALAGVTSATPDPEDGRIEREADGRPTGLLKEAASRLVTKMLPELAADDTHTLLLDEMAAAVSFGLTSLQDASEGGLTDNERGAVERAIADGAMIVRYRATVPFEKDVTPAQLAEYVATRDRSRGTLLTYGIAKGMLDGTVDAKTAVMLEPYVGGGNGLAFWTQADLDRTVAAYDRAGIQVQLHSIGDGAIRMALDAYAAAARVNGTHGRRHRVEHIEVPAAADVPRFARLGVIASTQAIFATPDAGTLTNYAPLIGPERAARANSFRQFDEAGAVQAFGSDYPVYTMNPMMGIYTAVTRQTTAGTPEGGWYPQGRIGVEAALRHYTVDAAYASFEEDVKGSLTPGKYADFVVLSDDMLAVDPRTLYQTRALLTVMGGRVTYRAPDDK
jgi:predicted amidohydrolase YtcJ